MFSISYPADEKYNSTALENNVSAIKKVRSLVSLNVTNTSNGVVWLAIWDCLLTGANTNPTAQGSGKLLDIKPIAGPGWYQYSVHGGSDLKYGLWVALYSTAALALAGGNGDAGNVGFFKVDYTAAKTTPELV
jgi:hypothetical protein